MLWASVGMFLGLGLVNGYAIDHANQRQNKRHGHAIGELIDLVDRPLFHA
jgi:hypothetical protein